MPPLINLSRRGLLKSGGALVLGAHLPFLDIEPAEAKAPPKPRPVPINAWLTIGPDGITVRVACTELGQGVFTTLPLLVAEELDVDWRTVRAEMAPLNPAYANPLLGGMRSGGGTSMRAFFLPMRQAGAAARVMMIGAAARLWRVPVADLIAEGGAVLHPPTDRRAAYGLLARLAARQPVPGSPPLRERRNWHLIGTPVPRLDLPAKVAGRAVFGADVRVPGMLYAAIRHSPVLGGALARVDETAIKPKEVTEYPPGIVAVVPLKEAVAVVADTWWRARSALAKLTVTWAEGANATQTSAAIDAALARALDAKGAAVADSRGDVDAVIKDAAKVVEAVYRVPFLAHAALEPLTCTASVTAESCELWLPTQDQDRYGRELTELLGLKPGRVKVNTTFGGGGFGRNLESDVGLEAAQISRAVGKPVQLIWTREEDTRHDVYRPAGMARITVGLDARGRPVGWRHRVAAPSILGRIRPAAVKDGLDPVAVEGIGDQPYALPAFRLEYARQETGVPVGYWRSFGHGANAFAVESMIDELAAAAGRDPLPYRRALLAGAPRALAALDLAADKAGWGQPLAEVAGARRGRGLAFHACFDSFAAQVVEVSVFADGTLKVDRVVCAIDCGTVVHPDVVASQIEGGIVFGLSAALTGKITIERGRVVQSNFHDVKLITLAEAPRIEVHIVASEAAPGGVSGLGVPPVAPALANAIFSAIGRRPRALPLSDFDLRGA